MPKTSPLASARNLDKLEFPKIQAMLAGFCSSDSGKGRALALQPSTDPYLVTQWQDETEEAVEIRHLAYEIPLGGIVDIQSPVLRLSRGGTLTIEEFLLIGRILYAGRRMKTFLEDPNRKFTVSALAPYAQTIQLFPGLEKAINQVFDEEGHIQDRASLTLASIRRRLDQVRDQIKTRLDRMIRQSSLQTYLQDSLVSIRNGHYVIPVKAGYRQKVPGIVHDQSASGATLYIEPMAIVQASQDLSKLEIEEAVEVQKILENLAAMLAPYAEDLKKNWDALASLDLIFAKARLSDHLEACRPRIMSRPGLSIVRARHPLIPPEDVVPIDVDLGQEHDCLVITGPNTGGKTVTLKTIGLLVLMHQAGLQLPLGHDSSLGLFTGVYADIGDEQSIEQSLSTFSSHFTNITRILQLAEPGSLILYDELGAGTDPDEGASLAVAILEHSMNIGAKVVATTHYGELKNFAFQTSRVQNASVEFDVTSLRPTYRLMMGVSGNSNAFDISRRIGLDEKIITRARAYMEERRTESERLLENLEESQYALDQERRQLQDQLDKLEKREEDLKERKIKLDTSTDAIINRAKDRAAQILIDAKRDADVVSKELKSLQKHGQLEASQKANSISRKLSDKAYALRKDSGSPKVKAKVSLQNVVLGQKVHLNAFQQDATVLTLPDKKGDFQVQAGIMKMTVNLQDISIPSHAEHTMPQVRKKSPGLKAKAPVMELDIRGKTVDEALPLVDKYLDDAYLQGNPYVHIIHGKGTGVLRKMVQDLCKKSAQVASYRLGEFNEGGDGVTVAKLK